MKKELAAAALLFLILCASLWNVRHLALLSAELESRSGLILSAAETGSWADAETAANTLLQRWQDAETYVQVFIRHPDIDAVSDALSALVSAVRSRDADACRTAAFSISSRLNSIRKTETPSLGSIF